MGLAARARRLVMARGVGIAREQGLVWCYREPGSAELLAPEGGRIARDYTVTEFRPGDVHDAVWRDRVAAGADDFGDVYAWDGRRIGSVQAEGLLSFTWPDGLAYASR